MNSSFDWRKLPVRRDKNFDVLVEKLCETKNEIDHTKSEIENKKFFSTIKELMVFAALVGYEYGEKSVIDTKKESISILLETYATTDHDAYIYLLALTECKSLDTLKNENIKQAISIFENYCNGGLKIINNWMDENLNESLYSNIIFKKVLDFLD